MLPPLSRLADRGVLWFTTAGVHTTLAVTTIGSWVVGQRVNLERALRLADRLGGHFVQGHVDGVARVARADTESDAEFGEVVIFEGEATPPPAPPIDPPTDPTTAPA